jgi:hypothetical protein
MCNNDDDGDPPQHRHLGSITHEALASDESLSESTHLVTATGTSKPGQLCQQLQTATRTNPKTRVLAANDHVAAAVHRIAKHPVKETTTRGVRPYRMSSPLQTPDGKYVVRDPNTPPIDVEFVAREGVELTAGNATMQVPFGELPTDAFAALPDGLYLAEEAPSEDAWKITDGDGSVVTTVDTEEDIRAAYPFVWDWFQPDRLSYCGDITIHYPDPGTDDLHTYKEGPAFAGADSHAALRKFLDLFTVHCHGVGIDTDEVFDRYNAWMNAAGQHQPYRATFTQALTHGDNAETATRGTPPGEKVLCDRAWRFPPAYDR